MATASPFLSEEQFLCSICLDVFTDPVSIPCGHNFCKSCIARHWEGKEQCQCPLCKEESNKGLKLRVNTGFREVVENFKKHHAQADSNSPAKPGQVPCDCCLGNKFKAYKTCLVCLTSYCETHLEPHQRVPALKRHKLTYPVRNLEEKICKKHSRILELFCRSDLTKVCVLCTEHSAHDTVPLEEAYVDKKAQMGMKKADVQEIKPKHSKKGKKTKAALQNKKRSLNGVESNQMQDPHICWFPDEGPNELNTFFYLPENMGFSKGRFYYVVEAKGKTGCFIGMVRESILRKRAFTADPKNGNWLIWLENNTNCMALHKVPIHLFLIKKPERIMVFVDYDKGMVAFHDADTAIPIYCFTGCKFKEKIFLFYGPTEESWEQTLRKKIQELELPWILIGFVIVILYIISQN